MEKNIKLSNERVNYIDLEEARRVTLLEVLDRALNKGVVIAGDLVISVADIDLIYLGVRILLSSVETMESLRGAPIASPIKDPS